MTGQHMCLSKYKEKKQQTNKLKLKSIVPKSDSS